MPSSPSADSTSASDESSTPDANLSWGVVALGGSVAFVVTAFVLQSQMFFRGEDWAGLTAFHNGPTLAPFDGALSLTSGAVFGLVASVAGWNVWLYRAIAVGAFLLALVAVYLFTRRVAGRAIAAAGTLLLATFTTATPLLTEPFTAHLALSIAALVVVVRNLDATSAGMAPSGLHRRDAVSLLLVAVLLATSWVGVAATATVAATLTSQRPSRLRWAAFGLPPLLWLAWFSGRGELATSEWNWSSRATYASTLIARTFQELACNSSTLGVAAATGFLALLWTDPNRSLRLSWLPLRWLVGAVAYALISTYRNGSVWFGALDSDLPDGDTWVIATFVVLAAAESVRGRFDSLDRSRQVVVLGGASVAVALSAVTLVRAVDTYTDSEQPSHGLPGEDLAAIESVGRVTNDSWMVSIDYVDVPAHAYRTIVDHLGSPLAFRDVSIDDSVEGLRHQDHLLAVGLGIEAVDGTCQWVPSDSDAITVEGPARVVAAAVFVGGPTPIYMSRRAPHVIGVAPMANVAPGQSVIVTLPDDGSGIPWSFVVGAGVVIGTCVD